MAVRGQRLGIVNDRGRFYWVKRVPKRYAHVVRGANGALVKQVRQALHTDSKAEAEIKAAQVEGARMAEWEALLAGDGLNARKHYEASRELATARGYSYRPIGDVAAGDIVDLVNRVLSLAETKQQKVPNLSSSNAATEAVLGTVPDVLPSFSEVLDEYFDLTKTRHLKKSEAQRHKWRLPRERAVNSFLLVAFPAANGKFRHVPVNKITRKEALTYRNWWSKRVEGGLSVESANKAFGQLSEIFRTWSDLKGVELANPFEKLRLDGKDEKSKPAFSRSWVTTKLLAPGALEGLNEDARDVLLITINTGCRPSEITDAPIEDFQIDAEIPFLRIAPHGRELKVSHTKRDIPLLGIALEAAQRIVARGGVTRYRHKAGTWSALVNKYLSNNGLRETPGHSAYSIRHYVENALLAAKVDDRIRADILGHKYHRPNYGDGGGLAGRREALELIAL